MSKTEWTSSRQARPEAAGEPGYNMTDTARKIIRENMGADGAHEGITVNKVAFGAAFGAAFGQFCADHATLGQVELYGVREDVVEICNNAWDILRELDTDPEAQR